MAPNSRILIADGELGLCETLSAYLREAGYEASWVITAAAMRSAITAEPPDLILFDLGLPDADGLEVARELANKCVAGLIIVSARDSAIDRIVGLELGADDYVTKPFEKRELLARVRSVLRRVGTPRQGNGAHETATPEADIAAVRFFDWELDLVAHDLRRNGGEAVRLTGHEFKLLTILAANPNKALSRDQLLGHLSDRAWNPFDRSIDALISKIRRKIEADPARPMLIQSIRGIGYKFAADAEIVRTAF